MIGRFFWQSKSEDDITACLHSSKVRHRFRYRRLSLDWFCRRSAAAQKDWQQKNGKGKAENRM